MLHPIFSPAVMKDREIWLSARVVKTKNSKPVVTNGPFGEIKETIGGFIVVRTESIEEAVEFAKGCPVLQGEGNSMEIRKIAKNDGTH